MFMNVDTKQCEMLRRWVFLSILLASAYGQEPKHCPENASGEPKLLWKISSPLRSNSPSYLFGTVHLPYEKIWPHVSTSVKHAYNDSNMVVMEVDTTDLWNLNVALMRHASLPVGQSLKQVLSPKLYAKLRNYISDMFKKNYGRSVKLSGIEEFLAQPDQFLPLWVYLFLVMAQAPKGSDKDREYLDIVLGWNAKKSGKIVKGIASIDEHFEAVQLDLYESTYLLDKALDTPPEFYADMFDRSFEAYVCGTISYMDPLATMMENLVFADISTEPRLQAISRKFVDQLLIRRNYVWVSRIDQILREQEGPVFFAFGIAHLLGQDSVVELLRRVGYTVTETTDTTRISAYQKTVLNLPTKSPVPMDTTKYSHNMTTTTFTSRATPSSTSSHPPFDKISMSTFQSSKKPIFTRTNFDEKYITQEDVNLNAHTSIIPIESNFHTVDRVYVETSIQPNLLGLNTSTTHKSPTLAYEENMNPGFVEPAYELPTDEISPDQLFEEPPNHKNLTSTNNDRSNSSYHTCYFIQLSMLTFSFFLLVFEYIFVV